MKIYAVIENVQYEYTKTIALYKTIQSAEIRKKSEIATRRSTEFEYIIQEYELEK